MGEPHQRLSGSELEDALAVLLHDARAREQLRAGHADDPRFLALDVEEIEEAARGVRRMVLGRAHRGTGGVEDWFPKTVAAWREAHPEDEALDALVAMFCASAGCSAWREHGTGISLEEAFFRFWLDTGVGDPETVEEEFLGAIVRAIAVTPRARFERPRALRDAPGGCYAVSRAGVLHAALGGSYVTGPLTPLIVDLLHGMPSEEVALRHRVDSAEVDGVIEALRAKGLL
jgi:hypothetical protein